MTTDDLCYTHNMDEERRYWAEWAQALQRWNLEGLIGFFLRAVGPLGLILAQAVYIGQPIFSTGTGESWQAAARLLEDRSARDDFLELLQEARR